MAIVVLLGPQRLQPTLHQVASELAIRGPVAAITAGWRERETEDDELAEHLEQETINLELYSRGEQVLEADEQLAEALDHWRTEREEAQRVYRMRLDCGLEAVSSLLRETASDLVSLQLDSAFEAVRKLDTEHLDWMSRLETDFCKNWASGRRRAIRQHRQEIDSLLERSQVLAIAGGHVGVLAELLRIFGFRDRLRSRSVLAWSAGAMAIGRRIVLFHDRPPQGFGNAEVWGPGLGLYGRYLPLPHARHRLRVDDPSRVTTLARRFSPQICVPMDEGERLTLIDGKLAGSLGTRSFLPNGTIGDLSA